MKAADVPAMQVARRFWQCDPDLGSQRQVRASFDEPTAGSVPRTPNESSAVPTEKLARQRNFNGNIVRKLPGPFRSPIR